MKPFDKSSRQTGVALVLSLLILLVLTVVGVAAMNSTIMQERMAGNASTQADVFETSSEGVTRSLELFYQNAGDLTFGSYDLSCGQIFVDIDDDGKTYGEDVDETAKAWVFPDDGTWHPGSAGDDNPKLEQKMYCCRSWEEVSEDTWIESPSKLFVLNRATFMGGADNSQSQALREIEVELTEAAPDDPTCAICAPGDIDQVDGGTSNAFRVDGTCGAALVADGDTNAETFLAGVKDKRLDNYDGGILGADDLGPPWNDPLALAEFVFWTKLGLEEPDRDYPTGSPYDGHPAEGEMRGKYWGDDEAIPGTFDTAELLHDSCSDAETCEVPLIHYVEGDVTMKGNAEGYGIMIINGKLEFKGTPEYKGLIISLGGELKVGGGGSGKPDGSFVFTSLKNAGSASPPANLYDQDVLHYQVLRGSDDEVVVMYDYTEYAEGSNVRKALGAWPNYKGVGAADDTPDRPMLIAYNTATDSTRAVIHYDAGTPGDISDDRFFWAFKEGAGAFDDDVNNVDGSEVDRPADAADWVDGGDFVLLDPDTGDPTVRVSYQPDDPTRDAYGRMIPDFVLKDNYPEEYGYNPNGWNWEPSSPPFEWGSTDFIWSGGGNEAFGYDCRKLQRVKHQLLCDAPSASSLPSDPNDPFFKDPDHSNFCDHAVAEELYGDPTPGPTLDNQKAWHMWTPSCDCLGISVEADMVVAGWRENLGWRDDTNFQGCDALDSPN